MSDVINGVSRELLERSAQMIQFYVEYLCATNSEESDIELAGECVDELRALLTAQPQASAAQSAPAGEREAPDGKLLVSAEPLRRVLNALANAPHQIRELQATREPVALFADNPINILIAEYNAAHGGDE